jgi:hypothetical protein
VALVLGDGGQIDGGHAGAAAEVVVRHALADALKMVER